MEEPPTLPSHHLPPDALIGWIAGTATPGEDLLIACHLTVCPACRAATERLEVVHAALAARAAPVDVDESLLDAVLARIDAPAPPPPPLPPACPVFPAPLVRAAGPLAQIAWSPSFVGVRAARVPAGGAQRVFLMEFPAAMRLPRHDHNGVERVYVLRGGYTDERDHFGRGDVSWRSEGGHDVLIDPGERCTALFVNDGPTHLGWFASLFERWVA